MNNQHLPFMKLALLQAQKAYEKDEIPVGAIVVKERKVIGRGYNQREMLNDPTAHAEICLLYTSPSPRDRTRSRMPSSA